MNVISKAKIVVTEIVDQNGKEYIAFDREGDEGSNAWTVVEAMTALYQREYDLEFTQDG